MPLALWSWNRPNPSRPRSLLLVMVAGAQGGGRFSEKKRQAFRRGSGLLNTGKPWRVQRTSALAFRHGNHHASKVFPFLSLFSRSLSIPRFLLCCLAASLRVLLPAACFSQRWMSDREMRRSICFLHLHLVFVHFCTSTLRIENIARGGHCQLPRAKKKEKHCECASAGRQVRSRKPFTLVSPKKRSAQAHARPPVLSLSK